LSTVTSRVTVEKQDTCSKCLAVKDKIIVCLKGKRKKPLKGENWEPSLNLGRSPRLPHELCLNDEIGSPERVVSRFTTDWGKRLKSPPIRKVKKMKNGRGKGKRS